MSKYFPASDMNWGRRSIGNRGQTAILGLVFLIGLVAAASVGIFLVAGDVLEGTEQQSENEAVETSFVELSNTLLETRSEVGSTQRTDMALEGDEAVVVKNTSSLTINYNETKEVMNFSTIEYETTDGTRIAHQGGGVFAETENETRVVSSPPAAYIDEEDSETLTFPILEPSEAGSISSGEIAATQSGSNTKFSDVVSDNNVSLEIQGPYYRGWETHFEQEAGEDAIDEVYHENNTVRIQLTQSGFDNLYEHGIVTGGNLTVGANSAEIEGDVLTGGLIEDQHDSIDGEKEEDLENLDFESIDDEINDRIDNASDAESEYKDLEDELADPDNGDVDTVTAGKYYAEDYDYGSGNDEVTFDVEDGDITLVVEDTLDFDVDHTVEGVENSNSVQLYTDAVLDSSGGTEICVEECYVNGGDINSEHFEILGSSNFTFEFGGSTVLEGVTYAPDAVIDEQGGPEIYGALIVDEIDDASGGMEVTHDSELEGGPDVDSEGGIPEIVYFNVVEHNIELTD